MNVELPDPRNADIVVHVGGRLVPRAARLPPLGAALGAAPCHGRPISRPKIYFIFEAIVEPLTLRQAVGLSQHRS